MRVQKQKGIKLYEYTVSKNTEYKSKNIFSAAKVTIFPDIWTNRPEECVKLCGFTESRQLLHCFMQPFCRQLFTTLEVCIIIITITTTNPMTSTIISIIIKRSIIIPIVVNVTIITLITIISSINCLVIVFYILNIFILSVHSLPVSAF
jgi:hypothetical protein